MIDIKKVTEKLKKAREDSGISQTELGNIVGLSKSAISKNEKHGYDSLTTINDVCDALGVSFESIAIDDYEDDFDDDNCLKIKSNYLYEVVCLADDFKII